MSKYLSCACLDTRCNHGAQVPKLCCYNVVDLNWTVQKTNTFIISNFTLFPVILPKIIEWVKLSNSFKVS